MKEPMENKEFTLDMRWKHPDRTVGVFSLYLELSGGGDGETESEKVSWVADSKDQNQGAAMV